MLHEYSSKPGTRTTKMIPRLIHQLWLGPDPIPDEFEQWSRTWQDKHPQWDYRLWTSSSLPPLINRDLFEKLGRLVAAPLRYGLQADLVRYEILARYGGVYADLDNECLRPLDDLMQNQQLVIAMEPVYEDRIPNDFIASRVNHPLLWDLIRLAPERAARMERKLREGANPRFFDLAGPWFLAELVRSGKYTDITVLPHQLIHPLRRWLEEGQRDYEGVAYVRNHMRQELGMWRGGGQFFKSDE